MHVALVGSTMKVGYYGFLDSHLVYETQSLGHNIRSSCMVELQVKLAQYGHVEAHRAHACGLACLLL